MLEEILNDARIKMKASFTSYKSNLKGVRTGRASTGLVESMKVDYYGSEMPLNQLAQINLGDSRMIIIQPWDKNSIESIAKSIQSSDLNISPNIDGEIIRLNIPPLTEETRKEIVRMVKSRSEESKITIRNIRRTAQESIRNDEKSGTSSQDECRRAQSSLEQLTTEFIDNIEKELNIKEKEIMQV